MKKIAVLVLVCGLALASSSRAETSIGIGARYFQTLDSLGGDFKESGLGFAADATFALTDVLRGQVGMATYDDGFAGSDDEVLSPQFLLLVGKEFYAGAGLGWLMSDGEVSDSPFLIGRVGMVYPLNDTVTFDASISYETGEWDGINVFDESEESDTVVAGIGLRFDL